jgi:hypothetical protein
MFILSHGLTAFIEACSGVIEMSEKGNMLQLMATWLKLRYPLQNRFQGPTSHYGIRSGVRSNSPLTLLYGV